MKVILHDDFGGEHDVTENVKELYDQVTSSMEWGSGFFDGAEKLRYQEIGFMMGVAKVDSEIDDAKDEVKHLKKNVDVYGKKRYFDELAYLEGLRKFKASQEALFKLTDDVTNFDEEDEGPNEVSEGTNSRDVLQGCGVLCKGLHVRSDKG